MNHTEIVDTYMRELRAAGHFTDGPNARRGSLQPFVHLDVSAIGEFDPVYLQSDTLSIRGAACGHQHMAALKRFLFSISIFLDEDSHRRARLPGHAFHSRVSDDIDTFILKEALQRFRHAIMSSVHKHAIALAHS